MNKIVIVEDDPFSQEFYQYILKREGFDAVVIEDGDKLFEFLATEKVSLIIMDINLKKSFLQGEKTNGIDLSRIIKSDPELSKIPVLLVTAYSVTADGPEFIKESLADDYITKPIPENKLLIEKIKKLIDG